MSPTRRAMLAKPLAIVASAVAFALTALLVDPGLRPRRRSFPAEEEAGILAALVDYQRVYQDLFASGGSPALIDAFPASREVKHQVFRDIGFVRDAGLVFVQDLATATVVRASPVGPATAEAVTYEEWNHVLQHAGDRVPASELKGMGQGFRYRLRREGTRWIVTGWELEDVPAPRDDGSRKW